MKINWYKIAKEEEDDLSWVEDKWKPVKSSWITDVAYYEPMGFFEVRLKNGQEYTFKDVPKKIYQDFMDAKSKGEFFNRIIRDKYGTKNK